MINKGRRWYSLCDILGTCGILEGIERMKKMTSEWEREGRGESPLIYSFKFQGLCSREQDWFSRSHHPISFTDFHPTPPWPVTERVHLSTTEYNLETRVPSFFLSFANQGKFAHFNTPHELDALLSYTVHWAQKIFDWKSVASITIMLCSHFNAKWLIFDIWGFESSASSVWPEKPDVYKQPVGCKLLWAINCRQLPDVAN